MATTVSSCSTPGTVVPGSPALCLVVVSGARGLHLPTLAVQGGAVGSTLECHVEERGHQGDRAGSEAWAAEVVAPLSAHARIWQSGPHILGAPRGVVLSMSCWRANAVS